MSEQPPDLGFQVRDRRHRSSETAPTEAPREPTGARPGAPTSGPAADAARGATAPGAPRAEPAAGARPAPTLMTLFGLLASLAVTALDGVPDPATGQRRRDLQQAAEFIDLLIVLRDKTEGHRTPEESEALTSLLYDLQMRYVRATSPGARG